MRRAWLRIYRGSALKQLLQLVHLREQFTAVIRKLQEILRAERTPRPCLAFCVISR